jgi:hypothetical protein
MSGAMAQFDAEVNCSFHRRAGCDIGHERTTSESKLPVLFLYIFLTCSVDDLVVC